MKKNILKSSFAAMAALLFTVSCTEQDQPGIADRQAGGFTATIEQLATKTVLADGNKVEWQYGDIISINGEKYSAIPKNPASQASFIAVGDEAKAFDGKYKAVYPADLYDAEKDQLAFPSAITYKEGSINTPMYAESETEELSFKNICGVLHLTLYSCNEDVVKSITVAAHEAICGPFYVSMKEDGTPFVEFLGGGNVVTLDCGQGVKLSADKPKDFFIPIPEGKYSLTITAANGEQIVFQKETLKEVEIKRSEIYHFEWGNLEKDYKNVYNQMALLIGSKQPGKEYNPYRVLFNMCGDDVCAADAYNNGYPFIAQLNDFTYTPDNEVIRNCYTNFYKAIDVCNKFLFDYKDKYEKEVQIDKVTVPVRQLFAEVRTLRGWLHFILAEGWGKTPIVAEYPAPKNLADNQQEEIFKWIMTEIDNCIPDIPERQGPGDAAGATKVTRGFAHGLAGKVCLFRKDYPGAVKYLGELIKSGNYALVPGERFLNLFHKEGNGCEEKIFELDMSKVSGYDYAGTETKLWACNDNAFVAAPWGGGQASKSVWGLGLTEDYVHAFLANDGDSYRRKAVALTSDEVFYDDYLTSYGVTLPQTRGEKEFYDKIGVKAEGLYGQCDLIPRKLIVNRTDAAPSGSNMTNFTVMRYAEALLLYAEALIESHQGNMAVQYVNMIQDRAGAKTISSSVDMEVVKDEKRFELWMEGCRWADIVRWGDKEYNVSSINRLKNVGTKVNWAQDEYTTSGGNKPHKLFYQKKDVKDQGAFDFEKHKFFPKPAGN